MADDEDWIQENYKDKEELLQLLFDKDQLTNVLDTSKENMETEHTRMDSEAFQKVNADWNNMYQSIVDA